MKNKKLAMVVATMVFIAGVLLAAYGVNAGENKAIRTKGGTVCLECIGIG